MILRFLTAIIFSFALQQMAEAEYTLRIDAGQLKRINTPVRFVLPDSSHGHWQLVGPNKQILALQVDERGEGTFIIPKLDAFETAIYKLTPTTQPTFPAIATRPVNKHQLSRTKQ